MEEWFFIAPREEAVEKKSGFDPGQPRDRIGRWSGGRGKYHVRASKKRPKRRTGRPSRPVPDRGKRKKAAASWRGMATDEDVRATINKLYAGGRKPSREKIYEAIGAPPDYSAAYKKSGIDWMDMASSTSDVAFHLDTLGKFNRAASSGRIDRMVDAAMSDFTGRRFRLSSHPQKVIGSVRNEIKNHLIFDLIFYHKEGRSDALFGK